MNLKGYGNIRESDGRRTLTRARVAALGLAVAVAQLLSSASMAVNPLVQEPETEAITVSNYSRISMDDGLSSNTINVVYRDRNGLMWFGTDEGLDAYDGYSVRSFTPVARDTNSIGGKRICDIYEFEPNLITVALADGGINVYDKARRKFMRSPYIPVKTAQYGSALGLCRQGDYSYGVFLTFVAKRDYVTRNEAPHYIDRQTGGMLGPGGSGSVKCEPMPGVGGKVAMLLTQRIIGVMDTKYENMAEYTFPHGRVYDICPQDAEHLLLATSDGIYRFDLNSKTFGDLNMLKGETVQALCRNKDGDCWVAYGGNNIVKWVQSQGLFVPVRGCEGLLDAQTRVNDIVEDGNGLLWLATSNAGVLKIDTKKPKISTRHVQTDLPPGCATADFSMDESGILWAACGANGLVRVDLDGRTSTRVPLPDGVEATCVLARRNESVFVGSTEGLWRYNSRSKELRQVPFVAPDSSAIHVRGLDVDCLGGMWVSTQTGLYRYNGATFEKMQTVDGGSYAFNAVAEDTDGCIWAGSCSGLFVKGAGEKIFKRVGRLWGGRDFEGVLSLAMYKQRMLVGTSEGVMMYDRRTFEPVANPVFAKFSNRSILSIVCDRKGVIWLSTNSEVGMVDINYGNVYTFNHRDGLGNKGDECRRFDLCGDNIYFGQVAAVNSIDTRNVSLNEYKTRSFVSEVVYGSSGDESLMPMVNDSTFAQLYSVNASTKIHVASSDYTDPARNNFKYKLNDGEWQMLSGTNEILVSGLLPGTYRLMLCSSNADMIWSPEVRTVYIRIDSPLWLSRPAVLFYAVWLMSIIWLILNFRFRKINKRMRLAEAEAKSKSLVEDQRNRLVHAINEQHASFNYAKRIQDALMPKVDSVERYFSKFFVFYKPKEIVSGDFYAFYHRDDKTFVVSADCTGHGVPGAFISILGIDHISNIVNQQKVEDAGEILTRLQGELRSAVSRIGSEVSDGMDITICVVYHNERKINFAGAMNDLYLIRSNEVTVFHGDRMSIGTDALGRDGRSKAFNSVTFNWQPGDMFYMFSDGYCDQFGGPEHKKFKQRRFKNLLLNVHKLPANDQRQLLGQKLTEWMGNVEQTDDISVVGFEP